jgi:phosphoglycolate phosphatase
LRFDLVLFDLDGTLVDSLPDIASALNRALASHQLPPLPLPVVRSLVGEGVVRLAEKALVLAPVPGLDGATLAREVVAHYEQHPCDQTRLYEGMASTLVELHRRGARLAVLTNKMGNVARALVDQLGLVATFDAVVGDGDGHPRKPAPDAALALFARLGVVPQRALMVGDGLPDLAVARAAHCPVAAAAWGYTDREVLEAQHPDHLVTAPGDLLAIVAERG